MTICNKQQISSWPPKNISCESYGFDVSTKYNTSFSQGFLQQDNKKILHFLNDKWPFQRGNNIKKTARNYTLSLSLFFTISNGLVILRIRQLKAIVNSYLQMHLYNYLAITHTSVFHLSSAN